MSYRDRKNPWHVIFDEFKMRYPELSPSITGTHPVIYPVVQIDFANGDIILYHGKRHEYCVTTKENYNRILFDMLVLKD